MENATSKGGSRRQHARQHNQIRIEGRPEVRHLDIGVDAENGTVMLSGVVDNQAQMDRVNMLTWMVEGIKKVDNKMSLRTS